MQKPVKGKTAHQDTDESFVLGILSAVILVLTILTIGSYADNQPSEIEQNMISENLLPTQQTPTPFLINTSETATKVTKENNLSM